MQLDKLRSVDGIDVSGKRVLVRVDLNVPVQDGVVSDATRIERVLPVINDLASRRAKVVILSHFGRPKGEPKAEMSLAPIAAKLGAMLGGEPVTFVSDCIGPVAVATIEGLADGQVAVLENLRFHAGEEANDEAFAQALAAVGDIYVNDAFSVSHRAHASTAGITRFLPSYAGPLLMAEITALRSTLDTPKPPVAAVVGGAKVSTKIPVLTNLVEKVDMLVIGGGMANTFLLAQGVNVGKSLSEPDFAQTARDVVQAADAAGCEILLPNDAVIASEFKAGAESRVVALNDVPADAMILDVGPDTVARLTEKIAACSTLLWNGPLGAFEIAPFGEGTFQLAREAARLTGAGKLVSVAGGGDTVAALNAAGVADNFSYVSTAGGAFLEWLEGRELPGVAALTSSTG